MKRGNWKPTNPNSDYKHGYVLNDNLTMKGYGTKNRNDELRKYLGWTIDADEMSRIEAEDKEKRRQEYEARRIERDLESKQTEDKQNMNLGQPDCDMIPNKICIKNIDALVQNPNVIAENIQKQNIIKKTRNPHPVSNRGRGGFFKCDFDQPRHINLEENKEELSYNVIQDILPCPSYMRFRDRLDKLKSQMIEEKIADQKLINESTKICEYELTGIQSNQSESKEQSEAIIQETNQSSIQSIPQEAAIIQATNQTHPVDVEMQLEIPQVVAETGNIPPCSIAQNQCCTSAFEEDSANKESDPNGLKQQNPNVQKDSNNDVNIASGEYIIDNQENGKHPSQESNNRVEVIIDKDELEQIFDPSKIDQIRKLNRKRGVLPEIYNACQSNFSFTKAVINGFAKSLLFLSELNQLVINRPPIKRRNIVFFSVKASCIMVGDWDKDEYYDKEYIKTIMRLVGYLNYKIKQELYIPLFSNEIGWFMIIIKVNKLSIEFVIPNEDCRYINYEPIVKHLRKALIEVLLCVQNIDKKFAQKIEEISKFTVSRLTNDLPCGFCDTGVAILILFLKYSGLRLSGNEENLLCKLLDSVPNKNSKSIYPFIEARRYIIQLLTERKFRIDLIYNR